VCSHKYFAIMADDTTDVSIAQQMSGCFRSVDDQLTIHEHFVGFYEPPSADAETLYKTICDVLVRLELDIADCRGQCFDGASTKHLTKDSQFTHCS